MKLLTLDNDSKNKSIIYATRFIVFLTFIYKSWLAAEMQIVTGGTNSWLISVVGNYIMMGAIPFLLYLLGNWAAYSTFSRSKFCPADKDFNCLVTKNTFNINMNIIVCVSNLIAGSLAFIGYYYSISITLMIVVLPIIMSVFTVVTLIITLIAMVGKENAKGLIVSMSGPSILLLMVLR